MDITEEALELLRQRVAADQSKTRALKKLANIRQKRLTIESRRNANIESVIERYSHQGEQLEALTKNLPELFSTILSVQEWQEIINEKFDIVERKLDMTLELQRFLLSQLPDSVHKNKLEEGLSDTWIIDRREALKQRLTIQHRTLDKLLEREAKLGLDTPVSLQTAIDEARDKIANIEAELKQLI